MKSLSVLDNQQQLLYGHCTAQPVSAYLLTYYLPVENQRISLEQSFTVDMPLLTGTSAFGYTGRRCHSFPHLHDCLLYIIL